MSEWTHVNASVRIDSMRLIMDKPDFGVGVQYEDDESAWEKCNIPCGSEGSLYINLWEDPSESSLSAYTANIFGDLRDYDNDQEIIDYFNRIVDGKIIRNGFFSIDFESRDIRHFAYGEGVGFTEIS